MNTPFAEIIEDINCTCINHSIALAAHSAAETELAEICAEWSGCHPDAHAALTVSVIGAKAKVEALSLLCQKLK